MISLWAAAVPFAICLFACGETPKETAAPSLMEAPGVLRDGIAADFHIDATDPTTGALRVQFAVTGSDALSYTAMGKKPEYLFLSMRIM